jgi:predicted MFS family arabinose efflux permease
MLVVLYFHSLGYSPLEVAMLFLFYEFFGMVTNLFGGWLAARLGLNITLQLGLFLQIVALLMLLAHPDWLTVGYVMLAQALSGIGKDLNKMSAKSSIKLLVNADEQHKLYQWVAMLTGSKNALKGMGFFLGAALLHTIGFRGAMLLMALALMAVLLLSLRYLHQHAGVTTFKPKFQDLLSKSAAINALSAARFFLFGSRDVWFVVALPVYLQAQLQWSPIGVGSVLATWVIMYGFVQALAPKVTGFSKRHAPSAVTVQIWTIGLMLLPIMLAVALSLSDSLMWLLVLGIIYAVVFAVNSAMHSYLIVSMASHDGVTLDVGFYYMANAAGRLAGTVLSGWVFQSWGISACLWVSAAMIAAASLMTKQLQSH